MISLLINTSIPLFIPFLMIKTSFFFLVYYISAATIAELIAQNSRLSRVAAITSQNPSWSSPGRITVFAPTNEAIAAASLPSGSVGVVTSNQVCDFGPPEIIIV